MALSNLQQLIVAGIANGCIYALLALGMTIIFNASNLVNLAQGELLMVGAMTYVSYAVWAHLPFPIALPLAMLSSAVVVMVADRLVLRPIRAARAPIVNSIAMTIGLSMVFRASSEIIWGKTPLPVPSPVPQDAIALGTTTLAPQSLLIVVSALLGMGVFWLFFEKTLVGRALQAASANPDAAWIMGIDVNRIVLLGFGLSGAMSGLAGVLVGPITAAAPTMGMMLGLKGFSSAVIGGFGSPAGSIVGGLLLGIVETLTSGYISSGYSTLISFALLLLVLFLKPSGIVPTRR
jgi:branched-chain amino acid transport system permease protein